MTGILFMISAVMKTLIQCNFACSLADFTPQSRLGGANDSTLDINHHKHNIIRALLYQDKNLPSPAFFISVWPTNAFENTRYLYPVATLLHLAFREDYL